MPGSARPPVPGRRSRRRSTRQRGAPTSQGGGSASGIRTPEAPKSTTKLPRDPDICTVLYMGTGPEEGRPFAAPKRAPWKAERGLGAMLAQWKRDVALERSFVLDHRAEGRDADEREIRSVVAPAVVG